MYLFGYSPCPSFGTAGSSPEDKRATESRWLMAVCWADSTAKPKRTPFPYSLPPYQGSSSQPAKVVVTGARHFLTSFITSVETDVFNHFQHLRILPLLYRFGSSSLIGCIFHLIYILTLHHSWPAGTAWIPAYLRPKEFLKDVLEDL